MPRCRTAFALLCLATLPAAAADDKYDLRGPAPVKGAVLTSKSTMTIKDADVKLNANGQTLNVTQTMVMVDEEEVEVLAVDGRQPTKVRTKVVKSSVTAGDEEHPNDLVGETIVSERDKKGKWSHKLVDGKPTDGQKHELDTRTGPENDDEAFPAEKVAVGHAWEVDAAKLTALTGGSFTDVTGKMKQKFLKVEKVNGEECAVVETNGTFKGKMKAEDDGDPMAAEFKLTAKSWKSLKTGVELKGTIEGRLKLSGKQKFGGQDVEMEMEGDVTGEQSAVLK